MDFIANLWMIGTVFAGYKDIGIIWILALGIGATVIFFGLKPVQFDRAKSAGKSVFLRWVCQTALKSFH